MIACYYEWSILRAIKDGKLDLDHSHSLLMIITTI